MSVCQYSAQTHSNPFQRFLRLNGPAWVVDSRAIFSLVVRKNNKNEPTTSDGREAQCCRHRTLQPLGGSSWPAPFWEPSAQCGGSRCSCGGPSGSCSPSSTSATSTGLAARQSQGHSTSSATWGAGAGSTTPRRQVATRNYVGRREEYGRLACFWQEVRRFQVQSYNRRGQIYTKG